MVFTHFFNLEKIVQFRNQYVCFYHTILKLPISEAFSCVLRKMVTFSKIIISKTVLSGGYLYIKKVKDFKLNVQFLHF